MVYLVRPNTTKQSPRHHLSSCPSEPSMTCLAWRGWDSGRCKELKRMKKVQESCFPRQPVWSVCIWTKVDREHALSASSATERCLLHRTRVGAQQLHHTPSRRPLKDTWTRGMFVAAAICAFQRDLPASHTTETHTDRQVSCHFGYSGHAGWYAQFIGAFWNMVPTMLRFSINTKAKWMGKPVNPHFWQGQIVQNMIVSYPNSIPMYLWLHYIPHHPLHPKVAPVHCLSINMVHQAFKASGWAQAECRRSEVVMNDLDHFGIGPLGYSKTGLSVLLIFPAPILHTPQTKPC